ncbi:MAG TPA: zf-HC2 domain-containing protein [Pyrinomonadaceae bacterium]|nr:zf-HC2 domain-containing protein [Pyrinomonadaceae bacterium]
MSCSFTEKVSLLIDGELGPHEAREVERHLLNCGECEQLRADFLNLRSEIAAFETSLQPSVQNRALRKILSRGERVSVSGLRWGWSTPAIAFASLLIIGAIIGLIFYQTSNPHKQEPQYTAIIPTPSPAPSPEPSAEPSAEPSPEAEQQPTPAPKRANPPAPSKKPLVREPKPGEQFAIAPAAPDAPERLRPADAETLTAIHFEKAETLLRAFRNVRLDEPGTAADVGYERKRARQLVYQNMMLRREADTAGDVQIASLLESLEPILLDIANLPDKPASDDVRVIRERVERKNIVALLQVNSTALARALD